MGLLTRIFGENWIGIGSGIFNKSLRREAELVGYEFERSFENVFFFKSKKCEDEVLENVKSSIFIQNAFPIHSLIEEFSLEKMDSLFKALKKKINFKKSFRIETRTSKSEIKSRDIEVQLGTLVEKNGAVFEAKSPEQIIFIVLFEKKLCAGVVKREKLVYDWLDLGKRISRGDEMVNHSQIKVIEAVERFGIDFSGKKVLDLGAAPGGWSIAALERGAEVVGIDPAKIEIEHEKFIHIQKKGEQVKFNDKIFDLILCDINGRPSEAMVIVADKIDTLKDGGKVLFTCKMIDKHAEDWIEEARKAAPSCLKILYIKQLISNRQEATIFLEKNIR